MDNQIVQRPDRHGSNNPMYGRHHTEAARQKMSQMAKERYEKIKNIPKPQPPMTMDEFLKEYPTVKDYIYTLIREEINKVIWKKARKSES